MLGRGREFWRYFDRDLVENVRCNVLVGEYIYFLIDRWSGINYLGSMELNPTIKFIPSKVKVSEDQISAFETRIGFKFPADYRTFLKLYNGPKMESQNPEIDTVDFLLSIDLRNIPGISAHVGADSKLKFFAVSRWQSFADPNADYQYGLIETYQVTSVDWRLPKSVIPIAGNVGPALVYLNLSQNLGFSQVLLVGDTLFDRQAESLEIRVEDFVPVASTFTEFVANLKWIRVDDYD